MDSIFRQLERAGKADVDFLLQWMKDSQIIESVKDEKVRRLFEDNNNKQQVELAKFKDILAQIAAEQSKTVDQLSEQLAASATKVIDAIIVELQAFKEALKKMSGHEY